MKTLLRFFLAIALSLVSARKTFLLKDELVVQQPRVMAYDCRRCSFFTDETFLCTD